MSGVPDAVRRSLGDATSTGSAAQHPANAERLAAFLRMNFVVFKIHG
jgi:hypothetical protein